MPFQAALAELLLPAVLQDLVLHACQTDALLLPTLASQLSRHVLGPAAAGVAVGSDLPAAAPSGITAVTAVTAVPSQPAGGSTVVDRRAVQLVLTGLEHLRSLQRDDMVVSGKGGKGVSMCTAAAGSMGSTKEVADGFEPRLWDKVYCLDLDYLLVARAAVSCGAHFTALLYVEQWLERTAGSLYLGLDRVLQAAQAVQGT